MSRRNNQGKKKTGRQWRQPKVIARIGVDGFKYLDQGTIGAVRVTMKDGRTKDIEIDDPTRGITKFKAELKFYVGYDSKNVSKVSEAIRDHGKRLKLAEYVAYAIEQNNGQLVLNGSSFLVMVDSAKIRAALASIVAETSNVAPTPSAPVVDNGKSAEHRTDA
jgi:hypothetical protein